MNAGDPDGQEVDDVDSTLMTLMTLPATGLSPYAAEDLATTAPVPAAQGTAAVDLRTVAAARPGAVGPDAVSAVPVMVAMVAAFGARSTDLPGPVPRGAPV